MVRRDEGAYCGYVTEEQRRQPGLRIGHIVLCGLWLAQGLSDDEHRAAQK